MSDGEIPYNRLIDKALRHVVRQALDIVIAGGLPGDHHFYITFRTDAPGIALPAFLRAQYPEEMTIVLQHQFWDLSADADGMAVTLSFGGKPERLVIPYAAMLSFADPFAKFALQFEGAGDAQKPRAMDMEKASDGALALETAKATTNEGASIVTLDSFRKKK